MSVHKIKRGLDLPIVGAPSSVLEDAPAVASVAILADDYPFMRPKMHVQVGDKVTRGQLLFEDRKTEGVRFCAPGAGTVRAINRGERRALQSVVITLSESEKTGGGDADHHDFDAYTGSDPAKYTAEQVKALLVESGLWTALRKRPFGHVPSPATDAEALFITAMDTRPLSGCTDTIMAGRENDFRCGLEVLAKLTPKTWLCRHPGTKMPEPPKGVTVAEFEGKHPAGLAGTHIHFLHPVHAENAVWHLDHQDVVAIGRLFSTGKLDVERIVALAGPQVKNPRLLRTRLGAELGPLVAGQLEDGENRVISGSVLGGRQATDEAHSFLGRFDSMISCLAEDRERVLFGWLSPGTHKFSSGTAYLSALNPKRLFKMTTTNNGSHRAMVPIGMYERVMPLDIEPTFLLRALLMADLEQAEKLGALELIEEDVALCSFASPGKEDYGVALRHNLFQIWKDG